MTIYSNSRTFIKFSLFVSALTLCITIDKEARGEVEETITEELVIELNPIDPVVVNNSTIITGEDEITLQQEKELLKYNKTIKIVPEIEFNEPIKDRILVSVDVVNGDYSYNETDFYIYNDDGVGKKEIEIEIPVLKDEKLVEVCVFYYYEEEIKCKLLDIENYNDANVVKTKFNLDNNISM